MLFDLYLSCWTFGPVKMEIFKCKDADLINLAFCHFAPAGKRSNSLDSLLLLLLSMGMSFPENC